MVMMFGMVPVLIIIRVIVVGSVVPLSLSLFPHDVFLGIDRFATISIRIRDTMVIIVARVL